MSSSMGGRLVRSRMAGSAARAALVALAVLGQCSVLAFIPSDDYAATMHLTQATCEEAGATWADAVPASCTAQDCSFTAGVPGSCAQGCEYFAGHAEHYVVHESELMGKICAQAPLDAPGARPAEDWCLGWGDCAYSAGPPETCTQVPTTCGLVGPDPASCGTGTDANGNACAVISDPAHPDVGTRCVSEDGDCLFVPALPRGAAPLTGSGECEYVPEVPETCTHVDVDEAAAAAAAAACTDEWRPFGCEDARKACLEAPTGDSWDMYRVRHVACSSRQGGVCDSAGFPCTAPDGVVVEQCTATDEALCAAVSLNGVPETCTNAGDCTYTPPAADYQPALAATCGSGTDAAGNACAVNQAGDGCVEPDCPFATSCQQPNQCVFVAAVAESGENEKCAAAHAEACAAVVVDGLPTTCTDETHETCVDTVEGEIATDCAAGYTPGDVDTPSTSCPAGCTLTAATAAVPATCGTGVDYLGNACALNEAGDGCVRPDGECEFVATIAGSAETCLDTPGEDVADCATGYTPGDSNSPSTTCPAGCTQTDAVAWPADSGCIHTPSDFFLTAPTEHECEVRDTGATWVDATVATCTDGDGVSIEEGTPVTPAGRQSDSPQYEPCPEEKAACRGTTGCNALLETISTAARGGTAATALSATYAAANDNSASCGSGNDAAGNACALNDAGDGCAVSDGSCVFVAAVHGGGDEFVALRSCLAEYMAVKDQFDGLGGACSWPAAEAAGLAPEMLVLTGTADQQTLSFPWYTDEMQCRWKVECPSTSALPHGKPIVNLRRIGTEPGFDTLRMYDGDSAPAALCETLGCGNGCSEGGCATGQHGTMDYEGPYWSHDSPNGALVLEFTSDDHNSFDSTSVPAGGFEATFQCVEFVEYGCTDPAANNYVATANVNAGYEFGDDFCEANTECMGPRTQATLADACVRGR